MLDQLKIYKTLKLELQKLSNYPSHPHQKGFSKMSVSFQFSCDIYGQVWTVRANCVFKQDAPAWLWSSPNRKGVRQAGAAKLTGVPSRLVH